MPKIGGGSLFSFGEGSDGFLGGGRKEDAKIFPSPFTLTLTLLGRWLNPDSVKIYARMTKQEYATWVDKLMAVKRIDTARTTSLPVMDLADAISAWGKQLHVDGDDTLERWNAEQPASAAPTRARRR